MFVQCGIIMFSSTEKVTKVCNPNGQWFRHPESNRIWSNYTQCPATTNDKLKVKHHAHKRVAKVYSPVALNAIRRWEKKNTFKYPLAHNHNILD